MANFLTKTISGVMRSVPAIASSLGLADAGKIIETDANGLIDSSFLPAGIGGNIKENLTAAVALTAGDYVFINGSGSVALADNGAIGTAATGFVLTSHAIAATDVTVYFSGVNTAVTATPGTTYFLGAAGAITATPPTFAVGDICQRLGVACGTNELQSIIEPAIEYATQ